MEKRNVPDRSITVREPGIRNIFRHSRKFRICKVIIVKGSNHDIVFVLFNAQSEILKAKLFVIKK